jgi:hypothetical protein
MTVSSVAWLSPVRAGSVAQRSRTGISGHIRFRGTAGRCSYSSGSCDDPLRRIRLWSRTSGRRRRGSRRAATDVRNDRGARPQTVEDHDRRSCHRRPLTWRFACSPRSSTRRSSMPRLSAQISHGGLPSLLRPFWCDAIDVLAGPAAGGWIHTHVSWVFTGSPSSTGAVLS